MRLKKNKNFFFGSLLLSILLTSSSCSRILGSKIPVIGLDDQGNVSRKYIPKSLYAGRVGNMLDDIKEETVSKLHNRFEHSPWKLRRFMLGLGAKLEFEVGPVDLELHGFVEIRFSRGYLQLPQ